jgi:hypothetical protein
MADGIAKYVAPAEDEDASHTAASMRAILVAKTWCGACSYAHAAIFAGNLSATVYNLARVADMKVPEGDGLDDAVARVVRYLAFAQHSATDLVDGIAACVGVLNDVRPIGRSRRAKETILSLLRVLLFQNQFLLPSSELAALHVQATDASLKCLDHPHRPVRSQATIFFAVLCRTMTRSSLESVVERCLALAAPPSTHSVIVTSRVAAVSALCSVLRAFPDSVPHFAPRLMCRLARWAHAALPATDAPASDTMSVRSEVATLVGDTMKDWWRAHRDEWHYRHKQAFRPNQEATLMELFQRHSYYV